jgi:hypothetical protein
VAKVQLLAFLAGVIIISLMILAPSSSLSRAHAALATGVVAESVIITDMSGNRLNGLKAGSQFIATIEIANLEEKPTQYVTIFEVRDSTGITVELTSDSGMLYSQQILNVSSVLYLPNAGDYSFRAFVMDRSERPMVISPIISASIPVRDISYPGVYVPLYKYPDLQKPDGIWNTLIKAKKDHPSVLFVVTVNPSSGPGREQNATYVNAISELKKSGVEYILGYIPTDYSRQGPGRTLDDLKGLVDRYKVWYPDINGVMLDQTHVDESQLGFYRELAAYARSQGTEFIRANPGTKAAEGYQDIFDNLAIYEGRSLPTVSLLQINTDFPKSIPERFSFTSRDVSSLDPSYVNQVRNYVGLFYITSDVENEQDRNPYNTLPVYFTDLVALLDTDLNLSAKG